MLAFTEWAIEILSRADAAARRFNPDVRVRIVREADGGVRFELTDEADPTDRRRGAPVRIHLARPGGTGRHGGRRGASRPADPPAAGGPGDEARAHRTDLPGSQRAADTLASMTDAGALRAVGGAGTVMMIGGAEDRFRDKVILGTFAELAGREGRPRRGDLHRFLAGRGGHRGVPGAVPRPRDRTGERHPSRGARRGRRPCGGRSSSPRRPGVFLTGGNQSRLTQVVAGTRLGDAISNAHDRGVVLAGTSAGRVRPRLAHGRLRPRGSDPEASDGAPGGRAGDRPGRRRSTSTSSSEGGSAGCSPSSRSRRRSSASGSTRTPAPW